MSDVERVKELADDLAALSTKIADKHLYDREQKILRELADLTLKLAQRVEELENPWVSVKDRLPEDNQAILTWDGKERCIDYFKNGESCNFKMSEICARLSEEMIPFYTEREVSHWTPLPQPPKGAPQKEES